MKLIVNCSPSRIQGYKILTQLSDREVSPLYAVLTRFTVNLQSVSFVLVEDPWAVTRLDSASLDQLEKSARIVKIRCMFPSVTFYESVYCQSQISTITFEGDNYLHIELEGFAHIHCLYALVKIEVFSDSDYSSRTLCHF